MALLRSQTLPKLNGRDTCNGEVKFTNSGGINKARAQNPSKLRHILNKINCLRYENILDRL